ncbi:MAG: haloacid dehalogenase-like hydrolase [Patescibacteria group bacterium]|nr:haloacid dehalogenase-like hydrolase [Patescibacteria group bacterium]
MKHKWCVAFDFDGTLLDPSFISILRIVKEQIGLSPAGIAVIDGLLKRFLDRAIRGVTTKEEETEWLLSEMDVFLKHGLSPLAVAPLVARLRFRQGALECLDWLKAHGVPVAVVSFSVRPFIRMVLAAHDALDLVDEVCALKLVIDPKTTLYRCCDDTTLVIPTNKGYWAGRFAAEHGVDPSRILGVGDSLADRLLGITPENRFGFASDEEYRRRMRQYFGEVVITRDFYPAFEWIRNKLASG